MDSSTMEQEVFSTQVPTSSETVFRTWYTGVMLFGFVLTAAAVPGNLLTIIGFLKYKQLRNPTNFLICNQSFGDLFTCVTASIFLVLNYTEMGLVLTSTYKYFCLMALWALFVSLQSSITNLLALSTDRFIAVYFPYAYYNWVTDLKVKVAVIIIWTCVIVINLLPIFGFENWVPAVACMASTVYPPIIFNYLFMLPTVLCLLVSAIENILIGLMATKKQRTVLPSPQPSEATDREDAGDALSKSQFKVTKMLLMVVGVFYLSWTPLLVSACILINSPSDWTHDGTPEWFLLLVEFSKPLLMFNAIANPFIYGYKNTNFRIAYFKLLGFPKGN